MSSEAGTVSWMAPEVFKHRFTEKADVFSLGALFFSILERDFVTVNGQRFYGAFGRPYARLFAKKLGLDLQCSCQITKVSMLHFQSRPKDPL